jgi:hypothetical protein
MIKFLISSAKLHNALRELGDHPVEQARVHNGHLIVETGIKGVGVKISIDQEYSSAWFPQNPDRWKKLCSFLSRVEEQPVIIELSQRDLQLTLTF